MNTRRRRTPARHAKLYQFHLQRWQLDLRVHTAAELAEVPTRRTRPLRSWAASLGIDHRCTPESGLGTSRVWCQSDFHSRDPASVKKYQKNNVHTTLGRGSAAAGSGARVETAAARRFKARACVRAARAPWSLAARGRGAGGSKSESERSRMWIGPIVVTSRESCPAGHGGREREIAGRLHSSSSSYTTWQPCACAPLPSFACAPPPLFAAAAAVARRWLSRRAPRLP